MIDAVVSFAVQKLGEFLIQEIVLHQNVRNNLEWLRNELSFMRSFIKDAEEKQGSDYRVQQWISEIVDVANDTVMILEEFIVEIESLDGDRESGFLHRLQNCACFYRKEAKLHNMGKKSEAIKQRLLDISRKRETYGIRNIGDVGEGPSSSGPNNRSIIKAIRRATSYVDEEKIFVGFQDVIDRLLNEILKDEPRRSVVSILGMGGLGKTTVARKLYNSSAVVNNFPYRAWVCVSQEYSIVDLLQTIIKSFRKGISKDELEMLEKMNAEDLERQLHMMLKGQRYIVVLDDVWQKEAWDSLKKAFPDCKNGSRAIITTRKKDVATRTDDKCLVHELRFLTKEESWDLFYKKLCYVDDDYASSCSLSMLDLGREMVQKCSGLPLAIIVLGGLLSQKRRSEDWQKVKERLWQHMKNDSVEISALLSLSYNDLSSALKQCFLYIGMFPEDYLINAEKLMWLWMAEDFLQGQERKEDIAEDYLNELIDRNLIQVAERFWGKIFECRVHDLLRDLAMEKAMEVSFFDIYDPRMYSTRPSRSRQSIHTHIEKYLSLGHFSPRLRSLLFFNTNLEYPNLDKLAFSCRKFRFLRVLDLENVRFPFGSMSLVSSIGDLIYLRYLGLTNTNIGELPKSIGNLKSLEILEAVSDGYARCIIPSELCNLTNLRHIFCRFDGNVNLGSLTNLRTLRYLFYDQWAEIDSTNLIHLQELSIEEINALKKPYSLESVGKLKSLRNLFLGCSSNGSFTSLESLSSCQHLLKLWLKGKIQKLELLNQLPQSITELTLSYSELDEDPMAILERFLNLRCLELDRCYRGKKIFCSAKGFPQLEFLRLSNMHSLVTWELENGALPVIRGLGIYDCAMLIRVPERLQSVPVLKKLESKYTYHVRLPKYQL